MLEETKALIMTKFYSHGYDNIKVQTLQKYIFFLFCKLYTIFFHTLDTVFPG